MNIKKMNTTLNWLAHSLIAAALLTVAAQTMRADATYAYAVLISATAQVSPPRITLNWEPDPFGAVSYTLYRKVKESTAWKQRAVFSGSVSNYTDTNVLAGAAYEYQIIKVASHGYIGYGYIYAGINTTVIEDRGKLVLIVANTYAASLSSELSLLENDLTGDGWTVLRHDVSSSDTPASVRAVIQDDYQADPANVKAVFLFGHVPIFRSGNLNYDLHAARPMPADGFYGDMDGDWSNDPSYMPSDVELMVGRVDLFNMPGNQAPVPWPSEVELLRNYLNKDHGWRHNLISVPRRALMANRIGDEDGQAFAASGYRNFEPMLGPGNTIEANVADTAPPEQRWISVLSANSYLWTYACGAGDYDLLGEMGTHGQYHDAWSIDVVGQDAKVVFAMLFGSWFGEWDHADDIMRAMLATPTMGLASFLSGRPHWFCHHMGLGEPIGYGAKLTMNNSTLYQNQSNAFPRGVHIGLMGDPTLRLHPVGPASGLQGSFGPNGVVLNWSPSSDSIAGYHVYRAETPAGPFCRLTSSLVTGTSFTDPNISLNTYTYMVRAVKLEVCPSGSYFNPSQGIFTTVQITQSGLPIHLVLHWQGSEFVLGWNSQAGSVYRVLAASSLPQTAWTDVSGPITATSSTTSWTESNPSGQRFYRVTSP